MQFLDARGLTNDFEEFISQNQSKEKRVNEETQPEEKNANEETQSKEKGAEIQAYLDSLSDSQLTSLCYQKNIVSLLESKIMSLLARNIRVNKDEIEAIKYYIKKDRETRFKKIGGDKSANYREYYLRIYHYKFRDYEDRFYNKDYLDKIPLRKSI